MGPTKQRFDRSLFTQKLSEPARQMQIRSLRCKKANSLVQIVDCELLVLREWVETVDKICRDTWQTQGEIFTAEFVREVLIPEVFVTLEARGSTIKSKVTPSNVRRHLKDPLPAQRYLAMEVKRLKFEMANRYEIEARKVEYLNAQTETQRFTKVSEPITGSSDDMWQQFHDRFTQLANEEAGVVRATQKDCYLRAYCSYEKHPEVFEIRKDAAWSFVLFDKSWDEHGETPKVIHEADENARGPYCLLKAPESGVWMLSDGVSENFLERFQLLAAQAGVSLRTAQDSDPADFWLHGLFHYLIAKRSMLLFCAERSKGGIILRVCEASATFCSRLARRALETATLSTAPIVNRSNRKNSEVLKLEEPAVKSEGRTHLAQNIDRFRKDCGWSFDQLSKKTGIDKKLVQSHIRKNAKPHPRILKEYADAFTKALGREVTASDLEKQPLSR